VPFVQGQLLQRYLTFELRSSCWATGDAVDIDFDSDMSYTVRSDNDPRLFVPLVDIPNLDEPSIVDAF